MSDHSGFSDQVLGAWAFLESIVWFIAADYILFLYGVRRPEAWPHYLLIVGLGSCAGIIAHFVLLAIFPDFMASLLRSTPFVQPWMFTSVSTFLSESVWLAVVQPFTLIAVKVWTYTVSTTGVAFFPFLVLAMIGRVIRWALVIALAKGIDRVGDHIVEDHYWIIATAWTLLFAVIMVLGEL